MASLSFSITCLTFTRLGYRAMPSEPDFSHIIGLLDFQCLLYLKTYPKKCSSETWSFYVYNLVFSGESVSPLVS
jgi:hypothetical protein